MKKRNHEWLRRVSTRLLVATVAVVAAVAAATPAGAADACISYQYGHVYYVAYQYSPSGPEYIVDLGDRSIFQNATDTVFLPDISASDFDNVLGTSAPNLWVAFFGLKNPTRDGVITTNGPLSDFQSQQSSQIGAANQIDSWATGLAQFANGVGSPTCSPNAATFPGNVYGSYQAVLNSAGKGHIGGQLAWSVESRLSDANGVRTATPKIHFNFSEGNPALGTNDWGYTGYFIVQTDGTAQYWPDGDGDFLPNVPPGSDPTADLCPTVNSTDNTDADGDLHAAPCDCNEADPTVWAIPGEVANLVVAADKQTLSWDAQGGGTNVLYDVLRGAQATVGGVPTYNCFASNQSATSASDPTVPSPGALPFLYLVRAHTSCGEGTVGTGLNATRTVPATCP